MKDWWQLGNYSLFGFTKQWQDRFGQNILGEEQQVPYPFAVHRHRINNALEIAYLDEGPRDGMVLLFVHGMGSGAPVWFRNLDVLSEYCRCVVVELPGHGCSSRSDSYTYSMSFYADVLLNFMNGLNLSGVTLVGHAMGGQVAITMALRRPEKVDRLVLIAPTGLERYSPAERKKLVSVAREVVASEETCSQICNSLLCEDLASQLGFSLEDTAQTGGMLSGSLLGILDEPVYQVLEQISQPTLIVYGQLDRQTYDFPLPSAAPQDTALAQVTARIPHGKLVVHPDGGHFLQHEKPEIFNKLLLDFLQ
jgi:pimeloyl-ACP methyl ester carboxylesterase